METIRGEKITISNEYFIELLTDSITLEEVKSAYRRFDKFDLEKVLGVLLDSDSYEVIKARKEALKKSLEEKENN